MAGKYYRLGERELDINPILITGCQRSGTSIVAGAIRLCGAFGGIMGGMFENSGVKNGIVERFLQQIGVDPAGQYPLPDVEKLLIPHDWKRQIRLSMEKDGYKDGPWFYKDARSCLIWPVWNYAFPNAKWIIVRRRSGDIVSSCEKTGFMKAFKNEIAQKAIGVDNASEGWLWWLHQYEKRFVEMITEGLDCKVVWPHRMVYGDYQQMMETIEWLGLKWNSKVLTFIDPKLWKSRRQ